MLKKEGSYLKVLYNLGILLCKSSDVKVYLFCGVVESVFSLHTV